MVAVNLIMALLEHLGEGLSDQIHTINNFYLTELTTATTSNYKNMIIQGLMMNISYDQNATIQSLSNHGALDQVFDFILQNIEGMDKDFEIKRLVIGLSTLTLSEGSANLDQSLQNRFQGFMKAIVYLCRKSLELRQKQQEKIEKAEVDNCE